MHVIIAEEPRIPLHWALMVGGKPEQQRRPVTSPGTGVQGLVYGRVAPGLCPLEMDYKPIASPPQGAESGKWAPLILLFIGDRKSVV